MKKQLLLMTIFVNTFAFAQLPATPLAIYEFSGGSLSNTSGTSAEDLTGSITSSADRNGSAGNAATISGQLIGANLGGSNVMNTTLAFWIKSSAISTNTRILQIYGVNGKGYRIELNGSGIGADCAIETTTGNHGVPYFSNQNVDNDIWQHIVVRTEEMNASSEVHVDVFVNGVMTNIGGVLTTGGMITNFITNGSFRIDPLDGYIGQIDDIYLYSRSLTDTEITNVYNYNPGNNIGVEDVVHSVTISAFPNPTTGVINFQSDQKIESISVLNLTGQKVVQFNNTNTIDISHLPSGIYTATIQTKSGKTALKKLVKE